MSKKTKIKLIWAGILSVILLMYGSVAFAQGNITITLTAHPISIAADGVSTSIVTATVRNQGGNPLADRDVTFSFVPPALDCTLTPTSATSGPTGNAISTLTAGSTPGQVTVLASTGAVTAATIVTLTAPAPLAAEAITVTAEPANLVANGTSTSTITALILGANDEPIAGKPVTFTVVISNPESKLLLPLTATTDAIGRAHNILQAGTTEGQVTIQVQADAITDLATVTLYQPQVTTVTVAATPPSIAANGVSTSSIIALVVDQFAAPMMDESVLFSFVGADLGSALLLPLSVSTNAAGEAHNILRAGNNAGQVNVQVQVGALTDTVTVTLGTASAISLIAVPDDIAANGVTTSSLTALVYDQFGAPLAGETLNFSFVGDELDTALLLPLTTTSDARGEAHNVLAAGLLTGQVAVRARSGVISDTAIITLTAPTPSSLQIWATPLTIAADGTSTSTIAVLVHDQAGVLMDDETVLFDFIAGLGSALAPLTDNTNASGVAYSVLTAGTTVGQAIVRARAGAISGTVAVTLTTPPPPINLTVTANPDSIAANGTAAANIVAEVRDRVNAPVSGQDVTFSFIGDDLNCLLIPPSDSTGGNGRAQSVLTAGTTPGQVIIQAQAGAVASTVVITLTPATFAISLTVEANPDHLNADGIATADITAEVRSLAGMPVNGQEVTFSFIGADLGSILAPPSDTTGGDGRAYSVLTAGTTAGQLLIEARAGAVTDTVMVTLTAETAPFSLTVTANPDSLSADGAAIADISVEVLDQFAAPVSGQEVAFSFVGDDLGCTLLPLSNATGGDGRAHSGLTAGTTAGQVTIQAQAGVLTATTTVTLTALDTEVAELIVTANPANVAANGSATATITALGQNQTGAPIADQEVLFGFVGADLGCQLTPLSDYSAGNGVAQSILTAGTVPGQVTILVQADAITRTVAVNLYIPEPTTITASAAPVAIEANGVNTSTITALVRDQFNNLLANEPVTFSFVGDDLNCHLAPQTPSTAADGRARSILTSGAVTGVVHIQAQAGVVTDTVAVTLAGAFTPTVTTLAVTATPASISADGSTATDIMVVVQDQFGSPMVGESVMLSIIAPDLGCGLAPTTGSSDLNGEFHSVLTAGITIGQITILAQSGAVTNTVAVTLTDPTIPVVDRVTVIADPVNITADGISTATLTAWVHDAAGLPLADQPVEFFFSGSDLGSNINPLVVNSSSNGAARTTLTAGTTAGQLTIRARVGAIIGNDVIVILTGAPITCTAVTAVSISGPAQVEEDRSAIFTAIPSTGASQPITYTWYWDDGSAPEVTTAATISHTYDTFGTFNVTVTARNCAMTMPVTSPVWMVQIDQTEWQIFMPVVLKSYSG